MKLFEFAYCGNYNASLKNLSILAPEKWSFGNQKDNSILKNYVEHTFGRLYDENKIYEKIIMQFLTQVYLIFIIESNWLQA